MDTDTGADDNKYTIGIAVSFCAISLPVLYMAIMPVVSVFHPPWMPWVVGSLFMLSPPLTSFITLYCGPWQHDWSRPKRILLAMLLSWLICGAGLLLSLYFALVGVVAWNCLCHGGGGSVYFLS